MPLIIERAVLEFGEGKVFITFTEAITSLTGPHEITESVTVNLPANTTAIRSNLVTAVANQTGVDAGVISTRSP